MKERKKDLALPLGFFGAFLLWSAAVAWVDVGAIGPEGTAVGLAGINGPIRDLIGFHRGLYILTDWLGLVPLGVVLGFALLGLVQWIRRKSILAVDRGILLLGGLYVLVLVAYGLFEVLAVNYRPVLLAEGLEISYPSSTTLLVLCVMPTAAMELSGRIKSPACRRGAFFACGAFSVFMVAARLLSGVHWFSDIFGGMLLSGGIVSLYRLLRAEIEKRRL